MKFWGKCVPLKELWFSSIVEFIFNDFSEEFLFATVMQLLCSTHNILN